MLVINRPFPVCRLFVASVLAINRFFPVCRLFVVSISAGCHSWPLKWFCLLFLFLFELEKVFVCFTESLFVSLKVFVCFTDDFFLISLILFFLHHFNPWVFFFCVS